MIEECREGTFAAFGQTVFVVGIDFNPFWEFKVTSYAVFAFDALKFTEIRNFNKSDFGQGLAPQTVLGALRNYGRLPTNGCKRLAYPSFHPFADIKEDLSIFGEMIDANFFDLLTRGFVFIFIYDG